MERQNGTVKWWSNPSRGYGFVKVDGGGDDIFLHVRATRKCGFYESLEVGQRLSFVVGSHKGRPCVEDCELLEPILSKAKTWVFRDDEVGPGKPIESLPWMQSGGSSE